jgi:hypothetical protein
MENTGIDGGKERQTKTEIIKRSRQTDAWLYESCTGALFFMSSISLYRRIGFASTVENYCINAHTCRSLRNREFMLGGSSQKSVLGRFEGMQGLLWVAVKQIALLRREGPLCVCVCYAREPRSDLCK